jgi:two-component system sensor histidine kinase DegS
MTSLLNRLGPPDDHNKLLTNIYFWITVLVVLLIVTIYYLNLVIMHHRWDWFWYLGLIEFSNDINGSLLYIPFIMAAVLLGFRGILAIWIVSMAFMMPIIINFTPDVQSIVTNILFLTAPMMIIGYISLQVRWRERERNVITEREKEKQFYLSRILKAQDDERKRIAQELHDDTTQILLVVATRAQTLISDNHFKSDSEVGNQLEWIKNTILHLSEDIRRISVELRPSILDDMEFVPAIESLVDSLEDNYGVETRFEVFGTVRELSQNCQTSIIRVVQEALTNIRRHSEATKAEVHLHFDSKGLLLTITDNGRGFIEKDTIRSPNDTKKLGIIGMKERVGSIGGTFDILSEPGNGTRIIISLDNKQI